MTIELAADLSKWQAKTKAWATCGSPVALKPKGRPGNKVTRMYAKTGWWPLVRKSELWTKAIDTLGVRCKPTKHKLHEIVAMADLGNKSIRI